MNLLELSAFQLLLAARSGGPMTNSNI